MDQDETQQEYDAMEQEEKNAESDELEGFGGMEMYE